MSNTGFAADTGTSGITGYSAGSDLQNTIQSAIAITTQYQPGNYAKLHRDLHPRAITAVYIGKPYHLTRALLDGTATTAVLSGVGAALMGTGLKMIEMGGGVTALAAYFSGAEVAAGAAVFLSEGTVLVIIGLGVTAYVAYRLITQARNESGPWTHPDTNPGDPPYLQILNAKLSIFPPQMDLQPYVSSTIRY